MTIPAPSPVVDFSAARRVTGRLFVPATVIASLTLCEAASIIVLACVARVEPDIVLLLAVATWALAVPAAALALAVAPIIVVSAWRGRTVTLGIAIGAFAGHLPLLVALLVFQPYAEAVGGW